MERKNYYAALGVAPNADDKTIRDAYRKLARQYHPDINPGDQVAEERFKEINEAYQTLSDPQKRQTYDALRQHQGHRQRGGSDSFNWSQWQASPGQRVYTRSVVPDDMDDLFGNPEPFSDFVGSIFGQGDDRSGFYGSGQRAARPRRGRDLDVPVEITLEEAFHGTQRTLEVGDRRIEACIPPGVRTGSRIRLTSQGAEGSGGSPPGDLYMVIEVLPHPRFDRDGDDLTTEIMVDALTAAIGGDVRVPTLEGGVLLKIPPRTQADKTFRLRGKGMPKLERPMERGDLYARVKLVLPEPLSDGELEALRTLVQRRVRSQ